LTLGGRIAVMGAGAMGTMLGARLSQAGLSVELIDADQAHVASLNSGGATVSGTVSWNTRVRARTPDAMEGQYDLVFLSVKQTQNSVAFVQLAPHLHRRSLVCTLQNGVPEPAVAAALGPERTLGTAVTWAGTLVGPGHVESTADPDMWRALLGAAAGGATGAGGGAVGGATAAASAALSGVRSVLCIMCACEIVPDLRAVRWAKLLVNTSFSGMSAALGCTFGDILDDGRAFACTQHIARECIRVADVQGIRLAEIWPGVDFKATMDFDTEAERLATAGIYQQLWGAVRLGRASMLQDLERGQKSEVDFINGLLSQTGRQMGVPTPVNDTVVRVVRSIEAGERRPSFDSLTQFADPM
jgi:2-dehydropantoate 2-reductase